MRCHKYSRSFGSIDRVDRWAVWRVLASLLPQTTLPQASPAAQLELDTRARRLRARGVAGNAILGAFRCRSPPSHPTFTPDNPLQTAPFLIARYDDARAKPTHARALRRRRRSLARSIARAVCGGSDGVRLHRPSRALRASRVTRAHAHVIAAHRARRHRFPFPLHARMRALRAATALARSLARSLARARAVWRWRWRWRWRSVTSRVTRVTRARARHRRASRASSPPPFPGRHPYARAAAAAALSRLLACSRARRRRRWGWGRRSVTSRVTRVKHVTRVARHARARAYHHRFARVITVFRPPRARPARARCCGGGARSLARARAVWRWRWRWRSVTSRVMRARHARHARACVRHHRASRASSPPPFPDVTHARARQRRRRCLVCSLARARGGGGGRSFARRACLARHARARARHPRHGTC